MRRFFANTGWLLGSRGINAALSLVYLALAARALGVEAFGVFTLVVAFAQALTGIASFQTWLFVVRWGNRAVASGTASEGAQMSRDVIGFAVALDLVSMVVGSLLAAVLVVAASGWFGLPESLTIPALLLCVVSLLGIRSTPTGILRLHDRYARASGAEAILPITRAVGAGLAALFMPTITGFLLAWGLAELTTALAYWIAASRYARPELSAISLTVLPRREAGVWPFVLSTNFSASTGVAGRQVLLLLVGAFGGAAMAGIYRVAAQLGLAVLKLGQAVLQALFPDLVRVGAKDHVLAGNVVRVALAIAVTSVLLAVLAGKPLISAIAGAAYSAAYLPMVILAAASAIELVGASWDALLVARRRAGAVLALRAIPMAISLAMVPWAITIAGASGVAATSFFASAVAVAGLGLLVRKIGSSASTIPY